MHLPTLAAFAALLAATPAGAATLHALTADGKLVAIDTATRRARPGVAVGKASGTVLAVALRPADGRLYGLTDSGSLVVIDPASGRVTPGAKLDKPLEKAGRTTINFNPVVDRLRVVGSGGTNYRIHPDTGAVTVDGALKYAPGTPFAGSTPRVTAVAYTNHLAGTKETAMYTVDTALGQINLQAPPNDGVQQPKKEIPGGLPNGVGFDILADGQGGNTFYLVAGGKLFTMTAPDMAVQDMGMIAGLPASEVVSLAAAR